MAKLRTLSETDERTLAEVVQWFRSNRGMNRDTRYDQYPDPGRIASVCYVAKVPSGGIPAMSGIMPGSVECQVYKIIWVSTQYEVAIVGNFPLLVFNVAKSIVPEGYIPVHLDAYGAWIADVPNTKGLWQGRISLPGTAGGDWLITGIDPASPSIVPFAQDTTVVRGSWTFDSTNKVLTPSTAGTFNCHVHGSGYFFDAGSLKSGTVAIWVQKRTSSTSAWTDVDDCGIATSQVTQSFGIYMFSFSFDRLLPVTLGEQYRVAALYANGTAGSPTLFAGSSPVSGPYSTPLIGTVWIMEEK